MANPIIIKLILMLLEQIMSSDKVAVKIVA